MGAEQKAQLATLHIPPAQRNSHGHPCDMPEKIVAQPKLEKKNKSVEMKCSNIGCTKEYLSDKNTDKNCLNHPGK